MAVQLILKNSSVEDKRPTAAQLAEGELALNYSDAGAFLSCKDSAGVVVQVGGVKINDVAPANPLPQTMWLAPTTEVLSVWDGSAWIEAGKIPAALWTRAGTTLSPATAGDEISTTGAVSGATVTATGALSGASLGVTGKATSASTVAGDGGTTLATKDYVDTGVAGASDWSRTGTELSPKVAGDDVFTSGDVRVGATTGAPNIALNSDGSAALAGDAVNIDSSGNVLIGGTLPSSPNIDLKIDGSIVTKADATINTLTVGLGEGSISTNTAVGKNTLPSNTTGNTNTATGFEALRFNTTGNGNVATGYFALSKNIDGDNNTASGSNALYSNTSGDFNTATGSRALYSNTTGRENTATGLQALQANVDGNSNVATGTYAMYSNIGGDSNTANGYRALYFNTEGNNNTASGLSALTNNQTGSSNTAFGRESLLDNETGNGNTAQGNQALQGNISGSYNTANGNNALSNCESGSGNIGVGFLNNVGAYAPVFDVVTEDNRIVLGHTAVTNAYVQVAWTVTSDERDKTNFSPVPHGLDFVNQLKPTQYEFRVDRDSEETSGPIRYGFKAQDIVALEGNNPVIIDTEDADHLKLKTDALVPVLVNAIKELTSKVDELQSRLDAAGI